MKKLLAILTLCLAVTAQAQHRPYPHHHRHHSGGHGWGWVAPALIGGAIVYGMTRPVPPPQPTVIYVPPGYPPAPYGYHYEQLLDANCNCYRWVLIQG
jgi:hypothetical protein